MSPQRPALFIGSSSEGLEFARAIRSLLVEDAEVQVWRESIFGTSDITVEALLNALPRFDFAVLVLSPDDVTTSRDRTASSPRDNVVFELGLFMGKLGRSRTFMVRPRQTDVKLPSDVSGMTAALYDWPRADGDIRAAVGAACDDIRQAVRALGLLETRVVKQIEVVQAVQQEQQTKIDALTFVVTHFLPKFEYEHLEKLASGDPFPYSMHPGFEREIRNLWALHFIEKKDINRKIAEMPHNGQLGEFFYVTDEGETYLRLRRESQERRG
jgi:hypothetical protein